MSWEDVLKLDEGYSSYNEERSMGTETSYHDEDDWLFNDPHGRSPEEVISDMEELLAAIKSKDKKKWATLISEDMARSDAFHNEEKFEDLPEDELEEYYQRWMERSKTWDFAKEARWQERAIRNAKEDLENYKINRKIEREGM